MTYSEKYSYTPNQEEMGRALEQLASNLETFASEHVYKECFSMMDLTTLKTDDTDASVGFHGDDGLDVGQSSQLIDGMRNSAALV